MSAVPEPCSAAWMREEMRRKWYRDAGHPELAGPSAEPEPEPGTRPCACGCGVRIAAEVRGNEKLYATGACRMRAKRARDQAASEQGS